MASVHSPFRSFIKPILFKLIGEKSYTYFQFLGKVKDIENKLVEEDELELLPHIIEADDEVIDIGANYAYITHRLAGICTMGKVYAFEPIPFTYNVCAMLVKKYKLNNVALYQKGVGARNETMEFSVPLADFGGISAGQAHMEGRNNELDGKEQHYRFKKAKTFQCDVVAIDSFLPDLKKLSFVKIDIEGAELFALQGMRKTIDKFHPVIMLEINPFFLQGFGIDEAQLRSFFAETEYSFFRYNKATKKLHADDQFIESNYIMLHPQHLDKFSKHIAS